MAIISGRKNTVHHQTNLNVWLAIKMQIFVFFMTNVKDIKFKILALISDPRKVSVPP